MEDKPFRWNLRERRALEAMLARALEPVEFNITIPKKYQQTYGAALSKQQTQYAQLEKFREESAESLWQAEDHAAELLDCCARVFALACNCDLVFVGRSPEPLFDHLSGLLYDTSFKNRLTLMHYSNARYFGESVNWHRALPALKRYLTALRLDPPSIMSRSRSVAFVDIADTGSTFHELMTFYSKWSTALDIDWKTLRSKIKIIGIVGRQKTSPKAYRWQQQQQWKNLLEANRIKNTSVGHSFLVYMGSYCAHKASISFSPRFWGVESAYVPTRTESTLIGLQLALRWFDLGRNDKRHKDFASILSKQKEMKEPEMRKLVLQLRKASTARSASGAGRQN